MSFGVQVYSSSGVLIAFRHTQHELPCLSGMAMLLLRGPTLRYMEVVGTDVRTIVLALMMAYVDESVYCSCGYSGS